ncbi:hypothetical protein C3B58_10260 [Lactonifactor longoviformis]|uniref:Tagaturonate epimerase n=1 Tax=Lactonifactor longoviformis DSM 17459 TaxID=1122155 RepID=A0A1M4SYK6_9CLOT|nr:tagaturonate epimerase family protein [Lactonifactor longoviformis]POP32823.1 hypothetical protein C3B58_10260 [Lactonifactor longoviformis]SHE37117.1 tagaturonate epimerase [Lactonifactor longoviformis DSM 17459]
MNGFAEAVCRHYNKRPDEIYRNSYEVKEGIQVMGVRREGVNYLAVSGEGRCLFAGRDLPDFRQCPMNHENRLTLNRLFPHTVPQALGKDTASIGCGDRLGRANDAHIRAVSRARIRPVLAQQSIRELKLTGRGYEDVIDAAAWSVFRMGWKEGYGADGDHLKTKEEAAQALKAGCSMITLDCSEVLGKLEEDWDKIREAYGRIPPGIRKKYESKYLGSSGEGQLQGIHFTERILMKTAANYHKAAELAEEIYCDVVKKAPSPVDYEISLDETDRETTLEAHFFMASELSDRQIPVTGIAPRFAGEFQKGIDYIGEPRRFRENLKGHVRIARQFGYKISVHSGSDKFRIFSAVAGETGGVFHIKTSGTSWLEAVRIIARVNPRLYRSLHENALRHLKEARACYAVTCRTEMIPNLEQVPDSRLEEFLLEDNSRQLLHITYGFQLEKESLRRQIYSTLTEYDAAYGQAVYEHFRHHLQELKCWKGEEAGWQR